MSKGSRAAQKEARPREILEAAFDEFLARGFSATRIEDIAARVGVTKGTIYVYFESKEQLFEAMVSELSQPSLAPEHYERALDDASATDVLEIFLQDMYRIIIVDHFSREIVQFLITEANKFGDLVEQHRKRFMVPAFQILEIIIERGCERGEFRAGARELDFQFLFSPLLGLSVLNKVLPESRAKNS